MTTSPDNISSLDETPAFIIHRIARRLRVDLLRFLQQFEQDLTPEKYFILMRCREQPGISQRALSDKALNDQPNMKRLVDSLVLQGLLERYKDSHDNRRYQIYLSHNGELLLKKILPVLVEKRQAMYCEIDQSHLRITIETLLKIESELPQNG